MIINMISMLVLLFSSPIPVYMCNKQIFTLYRMHTLIKVTRQIYISLEKGSMQFNSTYVADYIGSSFLDLEREYSKMYFIKAS